MPDGRVLFVPFTAPGDRVRVRVSQQRGRYVRGELETLLEPGSSRREPECSKFGVCGGCSWQHVDYEVQLEAKRLLLRDALERIGRIDYAGEIGITASPRPYRYRDRARVLASKEGVGYRRRRSHQLCKVTHCPVLVEPLDELLGEISGQHGAAQEWEISVGSDERARAVRLDPSAAAASPEPVYYRVGGQRLRVSPGGFTQANALLRDELVHAVCAAAVPEGGCDGGSLLELYCGAGLFTLPLAEHFERVWAVESNPSAVLDLRVNLREAALDRVEIREESVEVLLGRSGADAALRPDVIVLDPPRSGLTPRAAEDLAQLAAVRIVYLSCDPASLARDLGRLVNLGYRLEGVQAFDLFPQTAHVEALACLTRSSNCAISLS